MFRPTILSTAIAALLLAPFASAQNVYWDGSGTSWNAIPSWSTDSASVLPDPLAVPGALDTAIFNISGVNGGQVVSLDADQAALGLTVQTTGAVSLVGGGVDRVLSIGTGGITVVANAGTLTIGSATAGSGVNIALGGAQTWANNNGAASGKAITIENGVSLGVAGEATLTLAGNTGTNTNNAINGVISDGAGTLSLTMAGGSNSRWFLLGENTYSGVTSVTGGALRIKHAKALGSTVGGTTVSTGAAVFLDNAGTVAGESIILNGDGPAGSGGALLAVAGTTTWTGDITVNTGLTTGTGRIGAVSSATLNIDGDIQANGDGQLVFQTGNSGGNAGTIFVNGDISFAGGRLTKSTTGSTTSRVVINGTNDFGATTVSSGILQFGTGGTSGNLGTGNISIGGGTLALNRSVDFTIGTIISGGGAFSHLGSGHVTLTAANTHTGATGVTGGGALTLDFSGLATPTNMIGTAGLSLTGSDLHIIGKATGETAQTFNALTLGAGPSAINVDSNGGTANVSLGAITRNVGATLQFDLPATGAVRTGTSLAPAVNGILGGYATVGTTTWAAVQDVVEGVGNIVPFNAYTSDLTAAGELDVPAGGGTLTGAPNTIRFNAAGASTLTLSGSTVLAGGGILVTPNVGANLTEIAGNFTLAPAAGQDLVVIQNNTEGGLTIHPSIGGSLTKDGEGLLTLAGGNVANFTTRINAGMLSVNNAGNLGGQGTNAVVFPTGSTGALQITGNGSFNSSKTIRLDGNGRIDVPDLAILSAGQALTGPGSFTKTGAGTLSFSSAASGNSYTGGTIIEGGILQANTLANGGVNSGIGASSNDAANLVFNGGTLKYTAATAAASSDRLFTIGTEGGTIDASGGSGASLAFTNTGAIGLSGTNAPRTFVLTGVNADGNILAPILGNNGLGQTSLEKTGAGTWTLAGLNTYSGGTEVIEGTLIGGSNGAFGTGDVSVATTATSLTISSGFTNTIANTATLSLAGDGALDGIAISGYAFLASGVNELVGGLTLGGITQTEFGTYGATGSGATHVFNDYFQGEGVVTLVPEPSAAVAMLSGLGVLFGAQRFRRRR